MPSTTGTSGILAAKTPEMPGPSCNPNWFQESGQRIVPFVLQSPTPPQLRSLIAAWLDPVSHEALELWAAQVLWP